MKFLQQVVSCIRKGQDKKLIQLITENKNEIVLNSDFYDFVNSFNVKAKQKIKGSINVHGMGGGGIPKINLTSIACVYLSTILDEPIVKTGSRKNTSLMGSTDFFEMLGIHNVAFKEQLLEEKGFAYYDYLELSPWKRYKEILSINNSIKKILNTVHFFDYEIGVLGLGVSSNKEYYKFSEKKKYCAPKESFTFYTITEGKQIDELVLGDSFLDGKLIMSEYLPFPRIRDKYEVYNIGYKLIEGNKEELYWYKALERTVATFAYKLGGACSYEEGCVLFEKSFKDRLAKKKIEEIRKYSFD